MDGSDYLGVNKCIEFDERYLVRIEEENAEETLERLLVPHQIYPQ